MNSTAHQSHQEFILFGFSGFHQLRQFLFLPFFLIYIVILITNFAIIHVVRTESSLHAPVYVLISMLSAINICGTTTIVPKMLVGFLFDLNRISLISCLVQMFFIYLIIMLDCNVLLMMALDRYIAVCKPLHYIMTQRRLVELIDVAVVRSVSFVSPVIYLASTVHFCNWNVIYNFSCEHMALLNLACGNTSKIKLVGLSLRVVSIVFDLSFLATSYGSIIRAALQISAGSLRHKSLHTCGTHALVIMTVYFFSLSSSIVYRVSRSVSSDTHNLVSAIYLLIPAPINPLIYGLTTKEIRLRMLKLFGKCKTRFSIQIKTIT